MEVILKDVRLTFPMLWEPKPIQGSKPKFSAASIFAKDSPAATALRNVIFAVAKEKWGEKADEVLAGLKATDKLCVHDGDGKAEYDGYKGNLFVNASTDVRPMVIGTQLETLNPADGKPYSGCYINIKIDVWAQQNDFGKRINAKLLTVQFVRDGERLAGGAAATADGFEAIKTDATPEQQQTGGAAALF